MRNSRTTFIDRILTRVNSRMGELHGNQQGTISLLSVFALMLFTFVLVMIVNTARHLDEKIKLQNAVDAGAYSGGVILTRGMNGLAFTNHLTCDVFAMTAFLRECRDRNAQQAVPAVLDAWEEIAPKFGEAEFYKFPPVVAPLLEKVESNGGSDPFEFDPSEGIERQAVKAWSDMMAAASEEFLPVFEHILREELIPQFQRDLILSSPELARQVTLEIGLRHALTQADQQQINGMLSEGAGPTPDRPLIAKLWRYSVNAVGDEYEGDPNTRTLPAIDPSRTGTDFDQIPNGIDLIERARQQRETYARRYLEYWIRDKLHLFDNDGEAKAAQFANLFRIAACAQLMQLLNVEYYETNLLIQIRPLADTPQEEQLALQDPVQVNNYLEQNFQLMGVAYRQHLEETGPGLFRNPLQPQYDAMTYTQIEMYLPQSRYRCCPWWTEVNDFGGEFSHFSENRDGWPTGWNLMSQNWTTRLVPVTLSNAQEILSASSPQDMNNIRVPQLINLSEEDFQLLNTH